MKAIVLIVFLFVSSVSCCVASEMLHSSDLNPLVKALIEVESRGNDTAIGDKHLRNKAYGVLQIRQPCVDDVNRRFGTRYKAEECLGNRKLSLWIFGGYISMYATEKRLGRNPTYEDIARIWNGGPNGYKNPNTTNYWNKVKSHISSGKPSATSATSARVPRKDT